MNKNIHPVPPPSLDQIELVVLYIVILYISNDLYSPCNVSETPGLWIASACGTVVASPSVDLSGATRTSVQSLLYSLH